MSALIHDLLNISRIELGTFQINRETVNINSVIQKLIDETSRQIEEKKIILQSDLADNLPDIQSDLPAFYTIIENLLSNAIRYTSSNELISLKTVRNDGVVTISVTDTGQGIPKEQQDKIFSKSFRATNAIKTCSDGTGLGLYLVRSISNQLGYTVHFISQENKGTTFYLDIPLSDDDKMRSGK